MIFLADRTVRVRLIAEVADFKRQMGEATRAVDALPAGTAKAETGLGRLVQSAKYNREAWTTVGTAVGAAGVAILAVGAAALKTGISYNTLQQTSRAALTTLLGSAKAANAQMDKLDAFARTSPFAKQVFITAQQQLIGFGVAANKVVPILDAMQNAVAAMGGSNDQLAGMVGIFARIQSSAKITGQDLMEFGNRGIDAASLIGSQMGKTGAQIRKDITAGTLGAQDALNALTAGMTERFGGAAENVKNTFTGAVDRIKAAWRDFSGMLAEPLVGAEGGGVFIGLLNDTADVLRAFMALPDPIRNVSLGIVGLTGVAGTLGGGFLIMAPRILDTVKALKTMQLWTKAVGIGVGVAAGALVAATIVFAVWSSAQAEAKARANALAATLDKVTGAIGENTREVVSNQLAAKTGWWILQKDSVFNSAEKIGVGLDIVTDAAMGSADAMAQVEAAITAGNEAIRAGQWGEYTDSIGQAGLGADDFISASMNLRERLAEQNGALEDGTNATRQAADAMGAASGSAEGLAAATQDVGMSTEDATKALDDWRGMVSDSDALFISLTDGYQAVIDANTAYAESTADATESSDDSWETYYDGVTVGADEFIAQLQAQVDAQTNWETNILAITDRVKTGMTGDMAEAATAMIDELLDLGPKGAAQVELLKTMTDEQFAQVVTLWGQKGVAAVTEFTTQVEGYRQPLVQVAANVWVAEQDVQAWILRQRVMTIQVRATLPDLNGTVSGSGRMGTFGGGGLVTGAGTTTSDSIPALLSNREYVVKADAVDHYGPAFFDQLNAMRFASGGYVGGGSSAPVAAVGRGGVDVHVGNITAADPDAAVRAFQSEMSWGLVGVPS